MAAATAPPPDIFPPRADPRRRSATSVGAQSPQTKLKGAAWTTDLTSRSAAVRDRRVLRADGGRDPRLAKGRGLLERARTEELLEQPPPARRPSWTSAAGPASTPAGWRASRGYEVHLIDVVLLHVEEPGARPRAAEHPIASLAVGDARSIMEMSADAVVLLGPLYHLTEHRDRIAALREAQRGAAKRHPAGGVDRPLRLGALRPVRGLPPLPGLRSRRGAGPGRGAASGSVRPPLYFTTSYLHAAGGGRRRDRGGRPAPRDDAGDRGRRLAPPGRTSSTIGTIPARRQPARPAPNAGSRAEPARCELSPVGRRAKP